MEWRCGGGCPFWNKNLGLRCPDNLGGCDFPTRVGGLTVAGDVCCYTLEEWQEQVRKVEVQMDALQEQHNQLHRGIAARKRVEERAANP